MTNLKAWIVTLMIACVVMVACSFSLTATAEEEYGEFYPKLAIIIETAQEGEYWVSICEDQEGNCWAFYDDTDEWDVGDVVNLLMWNSGIGIENDEIVEVYWIGYTQTVNDLFHMIGWR